MSLFFLLPNEIIYNEIIKRLDVTLLKMLLCTKKFFGNVYDIYHVCELHENCGQQIKNGIIKSCVKNNYLNIMKKYETFGLSLKFKEVDKYCLACDRNEIQEWLIDEWFTKKETYKREDETKLEYEVFKEKYDELIDQRKASDKNKKKCDKKTSEILKSIYINRMSEEEGIKRYNKCVSQRQRRNQQYAIKYQTPRSYRVRPQKIDKLPAKELDDAYNELIEQRGTSDIQTDQPIKEARRGFINFFIESDENRLNASSTLNDEPVRGREELGYYYAPF